MSLGGSYNFCSEDKDGHKFVCLDPPSHPPTTLNPNVNMRRHRALYAKKEKPCSGNSGRWEFDRFVTSRIAAVCKSFGLFLVNDMLIPPPPIPLSSEVAKLGFYFKKLRIVLKRMKKQFSDFCNFKYFRYGRATCC